MSDSEKLSPEQEPDQEDAPEAVSAQDSDGASAVTVDQGAPSASASGEQKEDEEEVEKIPFDLLDSTMDKGSVLKLKFQVAPEHYTAKVEEIFRKIHKETIVEGFRKGKAPLNLIRTRFRRMASEDAILTIQRNVLAQRLEAESIEPLTDPIIDTIEEVKSDEPMVFSCQFEVQPKVENVDLSDLQVDVTRQVVEDSAVDNELETLRKRLATYKAEDNLEVHDGCFLTLDITAVDDEGKNVEAWRHEDLQIPNTEEQLPAQIREAIAGKRVGDVATATLERTRSGKGISDYLTITIKEIQRLDLPDLDDEFAKDAGAFETLDALREDLRKRFDEAAESRQREEGLGNIYNILANRTAIDLPSALIDSTAYSFLESDMREMMRYGMAPANLNAQMRQLLGATSQAKAILFLQTTLIQDAIGRQEAITVTDDEVQAEIARLAELEGRKPLALQAQLERDKKMDDFRDNLLRKKIDEFLLSKTTINLVDKVEEPADSTDEVDGQDATAPSQDQ